jgi:predicted DNA binding CopG/RHH family protein
MNKTKINKKFIEDALNDGNQEAWEKGLLGKDPKNAKATDLKIENKNLPTSIRLPVTLVEALKALSDEEGIPYQTYLKMILTRHVRDKRKAS